jgi:uncharacterized protein (TIGR02285 family)
MKLIVWLVGLCALFGTQPGRANESLALLYYDRPPYMVASGNGSVTGLSATPSAEALKVADIRFTWNKFASQRIMELIREDAIVGCGVGWFKNPEREKYAQFSRAIYQDKPYLAVTNKKLSLPKNITLTELFGNKSLRILVKEGFSYGKLSELLAKNRENLVSSSSEVTAMVQMIKANQADLIFLSEDEAHFLLEQAGFRADDFHLIKFADAPRGEKRYFMCSKKVPDSVMKKINAAIRFE